MTLSTCLAVTAVVWVISLLRSVRLRAFIYSLPLPITLVLLSAPVHVDGVQLVGIVALNVFFVVVSLFHHRFGWHILVADAVGIAAYVALAVLAGVFSPLPFAPVLVPVVLAWLAVNLLGRRHRVGPPSDVDGRSGGLPATAKLAVTFVGSLLAVGLGQLLSGFVVTFPYSGILVAVESRRSLPSFSWHFARNSICLVAFMSAYYAAGDPKPVALTAGWASFAVAAAVLHGGELVRSYRAWATAGQQSDQP